MNSRIEAAHKLLRNNVKHALMQEATKRFGGTKVGRKSLLGFDDGQIAAVTLSAGEEAECRQFYEDADVLITYSIEHSKWYTIPRESLSVSPRPTRISPSDGSKAYDARGPFITRFES